MHITPIPNGHQCHCIEPTMHDVMSMRCQSDCMAREPVRAVRCWGAGECCACWLWLRNGAGCGECVLATS